MHQLIVEIYFESSRPRLGRRGQMGTLQTDSGARRNILQQRRKDFKAVGSLKQTFPGSLPAKMHALIFVRRLISARWHLSLLARKRGP